MIDRPCIDLVLIDFVISSFSVSFILERVYFIHFSTYVYTFPIIVSISNNKGFDINMSYAASYRPPAPNLQKSYIHAASSAYYVLYLSANP